MGVPSRAVLTVVDNVPFGTTSAGRGVHSLLLDRPDWADWKPGQFVMIRPQSWRQDMPWARPLSICRVTARHMVLFFQVVGRGTERLARLKSGDAVTVWGPLGNGFAVEPDAPTLLLAGGVGIAPFAGYIEMHPRVANLAMLFGHKLSLDVYPADSMARRVPLESMHEKTPADLPKFQARMRERMAGYKNGLVLACGPMPFLRLVAQYAAELGVRAQVSLERRMACGVGACLGCVAPTTPHWPDEETLGLPVQTCTKGPVFWTEHLDWDAKGPVTL